MRITINQEHIDDLRRTSAYDRIFSEITGYRAEVYMDKVRLNCVDYRFPPSAKEWVNQCCCEGIFEPISFTVMI